LHATTPAVKVRMTRHYEGPDAHLYTRAEQDARRLLDRSIPDTEIPWRAAS
jgi:hypothetical protein